MSIFQITSRIPQSLSLTRLLLFLAVLGTVASCAQVSTPQGGPKDLKKPELVKSFPENQSLNFQGRKIRLEFDEYVQANDFKKQLLITPSVQNPYTFLAEKNAIEITFENPLEENTTYFLNFREAVQDITEKNKPANLTLTFSTGQYIDSGRVAGSAVTLLTNQPEKNLDVLLYPSSDTVNIRKNRPYYVTKTNDKGEFAFQNVKEGEYLIYGLADKNNNLIWDGDKERIAYLPLPIAITSTTDRVDLHTERIDTRKPFVISRQPSLNLFAVEYNEGIKDLTLTELTRSDLKVPFNLAETGKTLRIYPTSTFKEGQVVVQAQDSAGNTAVDTLKVAFTGKRVPPTIKGFTVVGGRNETGRNSTIEVEFEAPVTFNSTEPFTLIEDTVTVRKLKSPEEVTLRPSGTRAEVKIRTQAESFVDILPDSNAVIGVTGEKLSFIPIRLQLNDKPSEGSMTGKISTTAQNYVVELLNEGYKVVQTAKPAKTFSFQNLKPGTYYLRVKIDANKNGVWDAGDPNLKIPADPVYFHPDKIDVRANWEIEVLPQLAF
jgi:hypothetical protein